MSHRCITALFALIGIVVLVSVGVDGQTLTGVASSWTSPRTAWGDPDLQGRWTNTTTTPLERSDEVSGRALLTDEERAVRDLSRISFQFLNPFEDIEIDGCTYHQSTDILFEKALPYLAWEWVSMSCVELMTLLIPLQVHIPGRHRYGGSLTPRYKCPY